MINENATRHTLSVLVDNASGVLSQVSRLFSRKGYNIESLAVGATNNPEVSRITIELTAEKRSQLRAGEHIRFTFSSKVAQLFDPETEKSLLWE